MEQSQGKPSIDRTGTHGYLMTQKEATLPSSPPRDEVEMGLEAATSVGDPSISCFSRGAMPTFAGINTLLKLPFLENARDLAQYDVAFLGVPFDSGTTYRPGTRFGPQAMRRISALYNTYSFEHGVDLGESLRMCDLGDVFVIPSNIEKTFDQVSRAVSHVLDCGCFPFLMGGDHSLGFPHVRGVASRIDGNVGIIHIDRHIDLRREEMDERMHDCPWFHATELPNVPASNLVQIGIGGWQVDRAVVKEARERGTTILTMRDVDELGIDKIAEIALEVAWKDAEAVYLSFDIDSVDCGFVPGTGWPEPGGFLPREVLKLLQLVSKQGLCGMDVVEVSPPYDVNDITALLGLRAMVDVLATLVETGHLPRNG